MTYFLRKILSDRKSLQAHSNLLNEGVTIHINLFMSNRTEADLAAKVYVTFHRPWQLSYKFKLSD